MKQRNLLTDIRGEEFSPAKQHSIFRQFLIIYVNEILKYILLDCSLVHKQIFIPFYGEVKQTGENHPGVLIC